MNRFVGFLTVLSLALLLASCLTWHRLGPEWYLAVSNKSLVSDGFFSEDVSFEPCTGGLSGRVTFPEAGVVLESERVAVSKVYHANALHKSSSRNPVVIEAWCFAEGGAEVGYLRRDTSISEYFTHSFGGETSVYPPVVGSSLMCIEATETRGSRIPCVTGTNFNSF